MYVYIYTHTDNDSVATATDGNIILHPLISMQVKGKVGNWEAFPLSYHPFMRSYLPYVWHHLVHFGLTFG